MTEQPAWLAAAWAEFGVRETKGSKSNARVLAYYKDAGHVIGDDSVPWCAAFAGAMLVRAGLSSTKSLLARSYLSWGAEIGEARFGAITVLTRGDDPGAGHVGFFVGASKDKLFLLGGNQSDGVTVEAFDSARLLGYRWPVAAAVDESEAAEAKPVNADEVFTRALAHVLKMEGGFSDDPYDPGGPTNRGITLEVFARFKGVTIDGVSRARLVDELKRIPNDMVREIYAVRYWAPAQCQKFSGPLALMHFDASVNHGVTGAARLLQRACGADADGEIGPLTLKAIAALQLTDLLDRYASVRRERYRALPHFWRFGRGWLSRVDQTLAAAGAMAAETGVLHGLADQASADQGLARREQSAKGDRAMGKDGDQSVTAADEADAKWWGQSRTIWGTLITAAATVVPLIGPMIGVDLPADVIKDAGAQTVTAVQAVVGLFGTFLAIYGRVKAGTAITRRVVNLRL